MGVKFLHVSNKRINYSDAQQTALISQVERICPLCDEPLHYIKQNRTYRNYELAHIYPLNATSTEEALLVNEERLGNNLNDEDNIIPLCKTCHGKFDKPRTVEEYRYLVDYKKKIIARSGQEEIWKRYAIEKDIRTIIDAIYNDPSLDIDTEIEFLPKEVDEKIDDTMSSPTRRKIKNNVRDYYLFIREKFAILDQTGEDISEVISLQIKTFYIKQKNAGYSQQVIFENIVNWLNTKTKPDTKDGAEIMVLSQFF